MPANCIATAKVVKTFLVTERSRSVLFIDYTSTTISDRIALATAISKQWDWLKPRLHKRSLPELTLERSEGQTKRLLMAIPRLQN